MNRRNFFKLFSAGVAGIALEQAIPLGRVWSFPKKIVISKDIFLHTHWASEESLRVLKGKLEVAGFDPAFERIGKIGNLIRIKFPARFSDEQITDRIITSLRPEYECW